MEFSSQASIVLGGNIDTDIKKKEPSQRYMHLFEVLPPELGLDTAFLDRIHAFLPGWEMPKIQPENYAEGYGFITDYLAEIFTLLRRQTHFITAIQAKIDFEGMTGRNRTAIAKSAAGLLKLIYPHRTVDDIEDHEIELCINFGVECRERVIDQLSVIAGDEFQPIRFDVLKS